MVRKIKQNNAEPEKINNFMKHKLCATLQRQYFKKHIKLFEYLYKKNWCTFQKCIVGKGNYTIKIPEVFSIVNNPDETIVTLKKIFSFRFTSHNKILLDFSSCKTLDLCASTVTLILLLSHNQDGYDFKNNNTFTISQSMSENFNNDLILINNGLINYLNLKSEKTDQKTNEYIKKLDKEKKKIEILKLIVGGKTHSEFTKKLYREGLISLTSFDDGHSVVEFINNCLGSQNAKLSEEGKNKFKSMYGEISDNAEIHLSSDMSQFFCIGMFHMDDNGENKGSFVMFNFGRTIYEGLQDAEVQAIKDVLEDFSSHHHEKGNFNDSFDEEVLWTLAALQNKISRCYEPTPDKDDDRGTGLPKLISAFAEISKGNFCQKLNIISGSTDISLDISDVSNYTNGVIAFNESGNLLDPPSTKNVKKIKQYFPGTLISVEFNIAKEFVINKI